MVLKDTELSVNAVRKRRVEIIFVLLEKGVLFTIEKKATMMKSAAPIAPAVTEGQGSIGVSNRKNGTTTINAPTMSQTIGICVSLFNGNYGQCCTGEKK
jgi:hypothetical protein